jgi:hypothetical protein
MFSYSSKVDIIDQRPNSLLWQFGGDGPLRPKNFIVTCARVALRMLLRCLNPSFAAPAACKPQPRVLPICNFLAFVGQLVQAVLVIPRAHDHQLSIGNLRLDERPGIHYSIMALDLSTTLQRQRERASVEY